MSLSADDTTTKRNIMTLANAFEKHALTHVYSGPSHGGDTLLGWPLKDLADAVCPGAGPTVTVVGAMIELKARHMSRSNPAHTHSVNLGPITPPSALPLLMSMLFMRMRWAENMDIKGTGFEYIAAHRQGDIVHVWIITKDAQATTLVDDYALYPSDALITKLNLLKQG